MGDVIGDINSRRGRIEGMDDIGGGKMIRGFVPLSEMFGYATDLRSRTQGRGNYSMFFEKYEPGSEVCTGEKFWLRKTDLNRVGCQRLNNVI